MKEFNITEAKEGKPVCTRDGRNVQIITTELVNPCPVVGIVKYEDYNGIYKEAIVHSDGNGRYPWMNSEDTNMDLFMWESIMDNADWDLTPNEKEILQKLIDTYKEVTYSIVRYPEDKKYYVAYYNNEIEIFRTNEKELTL